MCGSSIRRRAAPDLADAIEERESERYQALYAELEDVAIAEWCREFGPDPKYRPDSRRIHAGVMVKMAK